MSSGDNVWEIITADTDGERTRRRVAGKGGAQRARTGEAKGTKDSPAILSSKIIVSDAFNKRKNKERNITQTRLNYVYIEQEPDNEFDYRQVVDASIRNLIQNTYSL